MLSFDHEKTMDTGSKTVSKSRLYLKWGCIGVGVCIGLFLTSTFVLLSIVSYFASPFQVCFDPAPKAIDFGGAVPVPQNGCSTFYGQWGSHRLRYEFADGEKFEVDIYPGEPVNDSPLLNIKRGNIQGDPPFKIVSHTPASGR